MIERPHPKANAFAYWIAGYQGFYEPIIRAWFAERGHTSIEPRTLSGLHLQPSIAAMTDENRSTAAPHPRRDWALEQLRWKADKPSRRIQLDLLLQGKGGVITGECKSWGGYSGPVTLRDVEKIFVNGPDSLFLFVSEIRGQPVVETYLVLWKRSNEHESIEQHLTRIYHRPVRLYYVDEILGSGGPAVREEVNSQLKLLDDAAALVRVMLGASG